MYRLQLANGIESHVVDAARSRSTAAIERVKTDALDGETLSRTLIGLVVAASGGSVPWIDELSGNWRRNDRRL